MYVGTQPAPFLGGSFMHICNDSQIGTVENAASVREANAKHFSGSGQGSYRNTTGTISDLHGPPGGSFMHICNDPQIGTVENAASVPICSSQPN